MKLFSASHEAETAYPYLAPEACRPDLLRAFPTEMSIDSGLACWRFQTSCAHPPLPSIHTLSADFFPFPPPTSPTEAGKTFKTILRKTQTSFYALKETCPKSGQAKSAGDFLFWAVGKEKEESVS